jgi:hypothetical protein
MTGSKGSEPEKGKENPLIRLLDRLLHSRYSDLYLGFVLLLIATIPRLFYISKGVIPNGVDEGIDIMAGRMWDFGYDLYREINTVQAPLMLSVYGLIEADPVTFRLFSTICSLFIMALVMWAGRRIGGRHVMAASGAFVALDLMFLHEARLASLDMFCLLWVSFGVAFFVKFRQSGSKRALFLMGISLAVSSMIKLFGVIATGTIGLILLVDMLSGWKYFTRFELQRFLPPRKLDSVKFKHLLIYTLSYFLVVLFIMARYGMEDVIQGIFINQLERPVLPFSQRLSFFGVFFLLNLVAIPFLFFGIKRLYHRPEGVLLIISGAYLLWFIFQSTTWIHHLVFLSPTISLTAGVGIIEVAKWWSRKGKFRRDRRKAARLVIYAQVFLILSAAVVGGAFSWVVREGGSSIEEKAAEVVMKISEEGDFVISGDPLVPAKAGRLIPPNLVNVAFLQFPKITDDELNETCIRYAVEVVVLTYHLDEMHGFVDFVRSNFTLRSNIERREFFLDSNPQVYRIFYLPADAPLRSHAEWGEDKTASFPNP